MSASMILLHLHKLLCSSVIFHSLHQLSSCSDVQPWHTCCVPCPPRIMPQTAQQCKDSICACTHMYTWWPRTLHLTTNWLLGVAVVLDPSAKFTFIHFTALFFREAKWPSASPGFTVAIISCVKTRAAHLFVLYGSIRVRKFFPWKGGCTD